MVFSPSSGGSILFRVAGLKSSLHGWEMPKEAAGGDAYMPLSRRGCGWSPAGTSASVLSFPGAIGTLGCRVSPRVHSQRSWEMDWRWEVACLKAPCQTGYCIYSSLPQDSPARPWTRWRSGEAKAGQIHQGSVTTFGRTGTACTGIARTCEHSYHWRY